MKKKISTVLMSLFLLSACESMDGNSISKIELDGDGYHLLFFSDGGSIELEGNYYDVLLDLRKQFPEKMENFYLVQSSNKNKLKKFQVHTYPTLLLYKDGDVVTRIEGSQSKHAILERLMDSIH